MKNTFKYINMNIDLNTITKEEFVNELIMSEDVNSFYIPREQILLSLDFDFEEMKQEFEKWLILNNDCECTLNDIF